MDAKLYMLEGSHPAQAGRLMVEHKGIKPQIINMDLMAGVHDVRLRAAGFPGGTVPALKVAGRKIQGTREIARALDDLVPDPPLLGSDPQQRAAIEAAETWGHDVLQPIPRGIIRAALSRNPGAREWFIQYMGFPAALAPATIPVTRRIAKQSRTSPRWATGAIAALPGHMDQVDALIEQGTIGGPQPNAADFQIAPSIRFLLAMEDVRPVIDGRPGADLARRLLPDYIGPIPTGIVPAEWLPQTVPA